MFSCHRQPTFLLIKKKCTKQIGLVCCTPKLQARMHHSLDVPLFSVKCFRRQGGSVPAIINRSSSARPQQALLWPPLRLSASFSLHLDVFGHSACRFLAAISSHITNSIYHLKCEATQDLMQEERLKPCNNLIDQFHHHDMKFFY